MSIWDVVAAQKKPQTQIAQALWHGPATPGAGTSPTPSISPNYVLPTEQQQALARGFGSDLMGANVWAKDPTTGKSLQPMYAGSDGADSSKQPFGFAEYTVRPEGDYWQHKDRYNQYGLDGSFQGDYEIKDPSSSLDTWGPMIVGGMALGGAMGLLGGGGAGVGAGAGAAGSTGALTGGGFVGEGALSGIAGWDTALASAPSWSAGAGAVAAGAGSGGSGTTTAATSSGLSGLKGQITSALQGLGMSSKDAIALGGAVLASMGGGDQPTLGGGGAGGSGGTSGQAAEAKAFLEAVMPYVRYNSSNPYGSAGWTRGADGTYSLSTQPTGANKDLFDSATGKFKDFVGTINPNQQGPELLDSVGGNYQSALASAIYDRTMGMQESDIARERRAMQTRLAEQGFIPGNEGYINEMNRWEEGLGEMRNKASMDAQIRAAEQALAEGTFTNAARTQGFKNQQDIQSQLAAILSGTRSDVMGGLSKLTSSGSAPTGSPANAGLLAQNQYESELAAYQNKQQSRNDIIRALMQWGLS